MTRKRKRDLDEASTSGPIEVDDATQEAADSPLSPYEDDLPPDEADSDHMAMIFPDLPEIDLILANETPRTGLLVTYMKQHAKLVS